jgi:hypothetical protein
MLEQASAEGELPLQYMLRIMRDRSADPKRRDELAKAAAPYCHARLTVAEAPKRPDAPNADEEWEELLNRRADQLS